MVLPGRQVNTMQLFALFQPIPSEMEERIKEKKNNQTTKKQKKKKKVEIMGWDKNYLLEKKGKRKKGKQQKQ